MKRSYKIIGTIVLVLIVVRMLLPGIVTRYVNNTLNNLEGYHGSVSNIDLALYRGAYTIDSLYIYQDGNEDVPLFGSQSIDLSLQWSALLDGKVVGEVAFFTPQLNFVDTEAEEGDAPQYGQDVDWTEPLKDLLPIQINQLEAHNGQVFFKNFQSQPKVDLYLNALELSATDLSNAGTAANVLPSHFTLSARSIGDGKLTIEGDMNVLKEVPDIDIDFKFEEVALPALNDFLAAYANVDAAAGTFNLYSEIVLDDSELNGYVKPILTGIKLLDESDRDKRFLDKVWQGFAGTVAELLENQRKDQFAIQVPVNGKLEDPAAKIVPGLWSIFSNAFVKAFAKAPNGTVSFGGAEK